VSRLGFLNSNGILRKVKVRPNWGKASNVKTPLPENDVLPWKQTVVSRNNDISAINGGSHLGS